MIFNIGIPKGLIQVLKERRKYQVGIKLEDMRKEIATHQDFAEEKTRSSKGMFLPKFHCELNPIERCWAQAKRYTKAHCNYSIEGLRRNIPLSLDSISDDNIKNHFRKVRNYMFGYLQGCVGGPDLEKLVQIMKKVYISPKNNS